MHPFGVIFRRTLSCFSRWCRVGVPMGRGATAGHLVSARLLQRSRGSHAFSHGTVRWRSGRGRWRGGDWAPVCRAYIVGPGEVLFRHPYTASALGLCSYRKVLRCLRSRGVIVSSALASSTTGSFCQCSNRLWFGDIYLAARASCRKQYVFFF